MYCQKCGKPIPEGSTVCSECAEKGSEREVGQNSGKFMPSVILGIIASIFGIFGGFCMTMCSSLYSSGVATFVLILGGSIVGLIGACKCLSDSKIGSVLQLVAAVMIMICAYGITGADMSSVLAMVLFILSGLIGLAHSIVKNR